MYSNILYMYTYAYIYIYIYIYIYKSYIIFQYPASAEMSWML